MNEKLIIIDCGAVAHRVKYGMDFLALSSSNQARTEIIFGFLRQLMYIARKNSTTQNQFVFAWDDRESVRREIYPEYKMHRIKKEKSEKERKRDEIAYIQFNQLKNKVLSQMGFKNVFVQEGYEADDIIAKIVKSSDKKEQILIVSNDEDLFQLLSKNVSMWNLKDKSTYTQEDFEKEYQIEPSQWVDVKAYAGCTTDNVHGIKGIGEVNVCKYLRRVLPVTSKAYSLLTSIEAETLYKRNKVLVELPFANTKNVLLRRDKLKIKQFVEVFDEYELKSFLDAQYLELWSHYFNLS